MKLKIDNLQPITNKLIRKSTFLALEGLLISDDFRVNASIFRHYIPIMKGKREI